MLVKGKDVAAKVLIVDDEPAFRLLAERFLQQQGYQVVSTASVDDAMVQLGLFDADLILLDLALPPHFDPQQTLNLVPQLASRPVIILTGHAERDLALKAISQGAWDFIAKPIDPDLLAVVVKRAVTKHQLEKELLQLRQAAPLSSPLPSLAGHSGHMESIRTLVQRIAPTEVRVLVTGPSGTGKEVISKALHQLSNRADKAFVSVHCGAIPAELLESELFGYVKGAFTGADKDRQGLLKLADGGTLFLDEIGEMPLPMQVKLLRVLQEGSYYPVGGREMQHIDIRLISATNANLPDLVRQGKFREDLYYRIKGVTMETVALDQRREDIPLLIRFFLEQLKEQQGQAFQLETGAMQWFLQKHWPGNVRELKNTLESVAAIAQQGVIRLSDIQLLHLDGQGAADHTELLDSAMLGGLDEQVKALEIRLIQQALQQHAGNKSQAARTLGISRQGLLKKLERYGLSHTGIDD
ncbi:sigma-54 dependent transcriptional regulator [Rheinheimera sp.]|uniref:sigma-54-dependent transcriptional regulator n=1 Tax=Rheinheimera sp. TaxID=1869214 RepID=UPI00307F65BA